MILSFRFVFLNGKPGWLYPKQHLQNLQLNDAGNGPESIIIDHSASMEVVTITNDSEYFDFISRLVDVGIDSSSLIMSYSSSLYLFDTFLHDRIRIEAINSKFTDSPR